MRDPRSSRLQSTLTFHSASCAPPITHAHIYGIDLASSSELIAYDKTAKDIAHEIGADAVIYQSLPDLEAACAELSPRGPDQKFEVSFFLHAPLIEV